MWWLENIPEVDCMFTVTFWMTPRNISILWLEQPEAEMEEVVPCSFCAQKN
jgi:hypothetical protein